MFYGWRVVAGTFVAQLFVLGFFTYSVSLLVVPVREEFGVSLEQVMYSLTVATLLGFVTTPVGGVMLDRLSVRWLMSAGALLFAAGLLVLARVQSITGYVIVFAFTMSAANVLAGSMSASTVTARWFTASRGRALGIGAVGVSVGGMLVPSLLGHWISDYGWRQALDYYAFCVLLVMLPAVVLLIRGKPEDVDLEPEVGSSGAAEIDDDAALTMKDILGRSQYWLLGISLGLLFSAYSATISNITPYMIDAGYAVEDATDFLMVLASVSLIGKLVFGFAADKMNLKLALALIQLSLVLALGVLAASPGYYAIMFGAMLMGLAAGGMLPVWGALVAKIFGLLSYGRAMGLMGPLITLCVLPGYTLVGRLYDSTGSYTNGLWLFTGVIVAAMVLVSLLNLKRSS